MFGNWYVTMQLISLSIQEKEQEKKDKKQKEKNDKAKDKANKEMNKSEKNHLKVLSVNGSASRRGSHVSLTSNGSIPNGSPKSGRKDAAPVTHGAKISDSNNSSPTRSVQSGKNTNSNNRNSPVNTGSPTKSVSSGSSSGGSPAKSTSHGGTPSGGSPAKSQSSSGSPVKLVVPTIKTEMPEEDTKVGSVIIMYSFVSLKAFKLWVNMSY